MKTKIKVCIIGLGRVGLPLALYMDKLGFDVYGVDINIKTLGKISNKLMPFHEPGCDELIKTANIKISSRLYEPNPKAFIITVGTPLMKHIETDLNQVRKVIDDLIEKNKIKGKLIILRSTVAPHTSRYLVDHIESKTGLILGKDFFLAMCPERIAEGKTLEELKVLPQIIGVEDEKSFRIAYSIFSKFNVKVFKATFVEAELSKLFSNIYRYISFSIPNYFSFVANQFGVDSINLLKMMKYNYPRNDGLATPGFSAGTCLRKDFGMINENFPQTDILLQAYRINEFMPKFLVDLVKDKIQNKKIGILGVSFKKDTDDTRDTLVGKLARYILRHVPKSLELSDPHLCKYGETFNTFEDGSWVNYEPLKLLKNCNIIFIGTNHSLYCSDKFKKAIASFIKRGGIIVDIWGNNGKLVLSKE